jgi:hypothetical protein
LGKPQLKRRPPTLEACRHIIVLGWTVSKRRQVLRIYIDLKPDPVSERCVCGGIGDPFAQHLLNLKTIHSLIMTTEAVLRTAFPDAGRYGSPRSDRFPATTAVRPVRKTQSVQSFAAASIWDISAEQWTAGATVVTAAVAAVAAAVAGKVGMRQLGEARELRKAQAAPYVVVYADLSTANSAFVELVVKNLGTTAAHDVRIAIDPSRRTLATMPRRGTGCIGTVS